MADNEVFEIYQQHKAAQDKYTYFLLATAAAAIGFAVQKTEGLKLSYWLLPVGFAVLCWGTSFFFGCRSIIWVQASTGANYNLVRLKMGIHPNQPTDPMGVQSAIAGVNDALTSNRNKVQFYSDWQFRVMIIGFLSFVAWRALEMARITWPA
jgi:hypothetical protein